MATDLETSSEASETILARPNLKITGLHIRGLKSIGSLDLPGDGMGWDGAIPDMMMIGGINGSGKTTLLEFLAAAFGPLDESGFDGRFALQADEARIDFRLSWPGVHEDDFRFLIGDRAFIDRNQNEYWYGYRRSSNKPAAEWSISDAMWSKIHGKLFKGREQTTCPGVFYISTSNRAILTLETSYKHPGKKAEPLMFVNRLSTPQGWTDTLEAHLYTVRWADLNAREEGRDHEANGFENYSRAFDRFFEGRKRLKWHRGELVVETRDGSTHDLSGLSSGETQVIRLMGELLHRWRPGSLILIDEPELHLHESYQTKLWEALVDWRKERGGQVIVATQSGHLFQISEPSIKVLMSRRSR